MKLIYFDSVAARDQLILENEGSLDYELVKSSRKKKKLFGKAQAEVGGGTRFLKLINAGLNIGGGVEEDRYKDQVNQIRIKNAILYDYLDFVKKCSKVAQAKTTNNVELFHDVTLNYIDESLAYLQSMTPYLNIMQGTISSNDNLQISLSKIDEAIRLGKGYYEMKMSFPNSEKKPIILRMNIEAFWNNYKFIDLNGMKLQVIAEYSGKIYEKDLRFDNIFEHHDEIRGQIESDVQDNIIYKNGIKNNENDQKMEMFDAVVIGVGIIDD